MFRGAALGSRFSRRILDNCAASMGASGKSARGAALRLYPSGVQIELTFDGRAVPPEIPPERRYKAGERFFQR
jgi:hypothetical protein